MRLNVPVICRLLILLVLAATAGLMAFSSDTAAAGSTGAQSWVDKGLEISKARPDSDEEAACYRRAIEADPAHASAHFNLAYVLDSQVNAAWRGADTAWGDLDKLYEALSHYASAVKLDPGREASCTNSLRIVRLLVETPTRRPPDIQTLRMHLRTCHADISLAQGKSMAPGLIKDLDRWVSDLEQRIGKLKDIQPREGLVPAAEIARGLNRGFTRGQSPYQGPRVPLIIHFDLNKDTIRPDSAAQLGEVAAALKTAGLSEKTIIIEGHTDSLGPAEYNADLSKRRALSVKRYLAQKSGLEEYRFQTSGYGDDKPLVPNDTDEHRAMNRRVEFVNGDALGEYRSQVSQRKRSGDVDAFDALYE